MTTVNAKMLGERIREARKRADLSQDDVAHMVGIDRTAVNKIEAGSRRVTALELADIATALGVRMTSFFTEPIPALVAHRSSQGLDTSDSQIDALLARITDDVEFVAGLDSSEIGLDAGAAAIPDDFAQPTTNAEADTLAARARRLLGLTADEPVRDLSASVATLGLLAFSRDIGKDTADAGTVLLRRGGVSLVNSHMKVGRRRLALAHELGHYLVGDDYTIDWRVARSDDAVPTEARLDRFARALLLPAASLTTWSTSVDEQGLRAAAIHIASSYRVDMATLAARLRELSLADGDAIAAVREIRTTRADIVEMNLHVPLEELAGTTVPGPYARAVVRLVRDERISRERGLELLHGTFDESDLPQPRTRRSDEIWSFVS
ncbi:helix-turn-helix domain-containing protein [Cellulomonas sp. CW35]|uniref:helix-turn-helix domain-containing protein n=1 Tax=Cellulomonas sp. CW35 TaxID=3458249 RepID=UPI004033D935